MSDHDERDDQLQQLREQFQREQLQGRMKAESSRRAFIDIMLEHVREDRFPSSTLMDLLESVLRPEELHEYLDLLVDKLEQVRYPSPSLSQRVAALLPN
jgi:hypothetical protein